MPRVQCMPLGSNAPERNLPRIKLPRDQCPKVSMPHEINVPGIKAPWDQCPYCETREVKAPGTTPSLPLNNFSAPLNHLLLLSCF